MRRIKQDKEEQKGRFRRINDAINKGRTIVGAGAVVLGVGTAAVKGILRIVEKTK